MTAVVEPVTFAELTSPAAARLWPLIERIQARHGIERYGAPQAHPPPSRSAAGPPHRDQNPKDDTDAGDVFARRNLRRADPLGARVALPSAPRSFHLCASAIKAVGRTPACCNSRTVETLIGAAPPLARPEIAAFAPDAEVSEAPTELEKDSGPTGLAWGPAGPVPRRSAGQRLSWTLSASTSTDFTRRRARPLEGFAQSPPPSLSNQKSPSWSTRRGASRSFD